MPRLLEVKGLQAFYGATQALFGVDFSIERGERAGSRNPGRVDSFLRPASEHCRGH